MNKAEETLNGANQATLTNHRHKHETAKTFMTFHYYKLHAICVYMYFLPLFEISNQIKQLSLKVLI